MVLTSSTYLFLPSGVPMNKFIEQCIFCGSTDLKTKNGSISLKVGKSNRVVKSPKIQYVECQSCFEKYTDLANESKIPVQRSTNPKRLVG